VGAGSAIWLPEVAADHGGGYEAQGCHDRGSHEDGAGAGYAADPAGEDGSGDLAKVLGGDGVAEDESDAGVGDEMADGGDYGSFVRTHLGNLSGTHFGCFGVLRAV